MHRNLGLNAELPRDNAPQMPGIQVDLDDGVVAPIGLRRPNTYTNDTDGNAPDRDQISKQITLRALSGVMFPKLVFPVRPPVQHRSEVDQSQ